MTRASAFLLAVSVFLTVLTALAAYFIVQSKKKSDITWEALIGRLTPVNRDGFALIASDFLAEKDVYADAWPEQLEPAMIWDLAGGLQGLQAIEANCDVLIDIAFYVQRQYPQALLIAEELRLNAREVRWHVERLKGAAQTGNLRLSFPDYAPRAVTTYCQMTQRLITLYETLNLPEVSDLRLAI